MQRIFQEYKIQCTYSLLSHIYLLRYSLLIFYYKERFNNVPFFLLETSYVLLQLRDNQFLTKYSNSYTFFLLRKDIIWGKLNQALDDTDQRLVASLFLPSPNDIQRIMLGVKVSGCQGVSWLRRLITGVKNSGFQ